MVTNNFVAWNFDILSSAAAKEAGLVLTRVIFSSAAGDEQHVASQLKEIQRDFGAPTFSDVPDFRGQEFFDRVLKLTYELLETRQNP